MQSTADSLVKVATKLTEVEAVAVVALLEDYGIKAITTGETAACVLSGAVRGVEVSVTDSGFERASVILKQRQTDEGTLNWKDVDIGAPSESEAPDRVFQHKLKKWIVVFGFLVGLIWLGEIILHLASLF